MAAIGLIISTIIWFTFYRTCKYLEVTGTTAPVSVKADKYLLWKWRNFLLSLVHATISGLWTVFCFLNQPSLLDAAHGMLNTQSKPAYYLASFSHGYFVYDLMEMVLNLSYKGSGELVFHHLIVITCLTITIMSQQYFGYACLALTVELSNIVLHFRQLLILAGVEKRSTLYRVNCWINIASFLLFRVLVLFWLGRSLILHHQHVPVKTYWIATFGWFVIAIMTVILFYRLILSDFGKASYKSTHKSNQNSHEKLNSSTGPSSSTLPSSSSSSSSATSSSSASLAAAGEAVYPLLRSR